MIRHYKQFVSWELRTVEEHGKIVIKKLPIDARTGHAIDHLNPLNWKTYDECVATGKPVGFVVTANDPFFFLDLDKCREPNGQWSQAATQVFQMFPGVAAEISQSGNGIHIVGTCDQFQLANKRRKWAGWLEFYTADRFIAFGSQWGWQGDFRIDCTAQLLQLVPERDIVSDIAEISDGPCAEYTGPEDDAELIRKALQAKSTGAVFGQRATFEHLWTGDASFLCQVFPSPGGDAFDRSSADAALMSHLAFWTGKDAPRMDRLFRQSALMREKYERRPQYRNDAVKNAVGLCKKVYDMPRPVARMSNIEPGEDDAPLPSGEIMDVETQRQYFNGCVYISDNHRVLTPKGELLRPEQFKTWYGGYEFLMSRDGTKPSRNAFEAFTENRAFAFPKVKGTIFRPKEMPGRIIDNHVNVYFPQRIDAVEGDVSRFLDLLVKQLPNERDRLILTCFMASLVQNIGTKFNWAPVLQGAPGNGKTFVAKCLEHAVSATYTHSPAAEDLANPFNSYLENKILIIVEEIHMSGKREILDTLKPLITNDRVEIQPKGVDKKMVDNIANWFFCTNYKDAILKTKDDRRYSMFFTAQQSVADIERCGMGGNYWPDMWKWAKGGGFSHITHYLMNYNIPPSYDPADMCHRAPETSYTDEAISKSMGFIEQHILEAVAQEERGFKNGWVSAWGMDTLFKAKGIKLAPGKRIQMLEDIGYMFACRSSRIVMDEGGRPQLFIRKEQWRPDLTLDDYMTAQGYDLVPSKMPGM